MYWSWSTFPTRSVDSVEEERERFRNEAEAGPDNEVQLDRLEGSESAMCKADVLRCRDPVEIVLRVGIRKYFEASEDEARSDEPSGSSNREENLPLKAADPMLGADARALLVKLNQGSNSQVDS